MRLKKDNKGAAMIVALVVMTVLMMFCLSLLLVVYSLYTSILKKNSALQCKEACKTMSFELQSELTEPEYADYESQRAAKEGVTGTGGDSLWFYIRYNIWRTRGLTTAVPRRGMERIRLTDISPLPRRRMWQVWLRT